MSEPIPTELPELDPDPEERDIALADEAVVRKGYPRLDVARKLQRQVAFLQHFRASGVVAMACRLTGVSRRLVYGFWRKDPLFEAAFQEANEEAADVIEAELFRRGVEGVDEPLVHMGIISMAEDPETGELSPVTVKKYSEGCLLALIKARKPAQFRDNHKVDMSVTGGTGVLVVPGAVDPEAWAAAAEIQQKRFRPDDDAKKGN
jgi:hypothetical protein